MSLETAIESLAAEVKTLRTTVDAFLAAVKGGKPEAVKETPPAAPTPVRRGGRPPKANSQAKPAAAKATATAAAPPTSAPEKPIRYDDVLAAITGVADRKGEAAARALLAKFNGADGNPCRGAKAVLQKDYASFVAECSAA